MTQWEGAASFLLLTPTAKIKEFLLLSTLSSQISLSPAHIPDSVQAAGSWMVSLQILPACLQVITPDGPIYSASRFRTMVPWTRTCWTNAVRLLEFLHSSRLCVCVCVCLFFHVCSPAGLSRELRLHSDRRGVCGGQLAGCSSAFSKRDLAVRDLSL